MAGRVHLGDRRPPAGELLVWLLVVVGVLNFTPSLFNAHNVAAEPAWRKVLKDLPVAAVLAYAALTAYRSGWRPRVAWRSPRDAVAWVFPPAGARPSPVVLWQRRMVGALGALAVFVLITSAVIRPPVSGLAVSTRYYVVYPLLMWAIVVLLPEAAARRRVLVLLVVLGGIEGVIAILNFAGYPSDTFYADYVTIGGRAYARAIGTLGNPDNLALFLGLPIVLLAAGAAVRGRWRWVLLVCAAVGAALTFSKAVGAGLALGLATLLLVREGRRSRRATVLTLGALGAVAVVLFAVSVVVRHGNDTGVEAILGSRDDTWSLSASLWVDRVDLFLIGGGFGSLAQSVGGGVSEFVTDSMVFSLLLEGGVVGLALFASVVFCALRILVMALATIRDRTTQALVAYAAFFVPYSLISVNFRLVPAAMFFWLTAGLALAAVLAHEKGSRDLEQDLARPLERHVPAEAAGPVAQRS